jgi:hypothetical protein
MNPFQSEIEEPPEPTQEQIWGRIPPRVRRGIMEIAHSMTMRIHGIPRSERGFHIEETAGIATMIRDTYLLSDE